MSKFKDVIQMCEKHLSASDLDHLALVMAQWFDGARTPSGLYRHHPSGQIYLVLGIAGCHETGARRVVYVSLETERPGPRVRTRLLDGPEGFASVSVDGVTPRFSFLGVEMPSR